jgi:hypothetical protein
MANRQHFVRRYPLNRRPVLRIPKQDHRGDLGCRGGGKGGSSLVHELCALRVARKEKGRVGAGGEGAVY